MAVRAAQVHTEVWTIDETQRKQWDAFLAENGVTEGYLKTVLSSNRAAEIQFGTVQFPEKHSPKTQETRTSSLLWSNEQVEVYMPGNPRVVNHLSVVLKRPVKTMSEVTEDESIELRAVVHKIQWFLRTHFRTPSLLVQWNLSQPGYLPDRFTIDVIPTRPKSAQVFNVLERVENHTYCLFQDQFSSSLPVPSQEEILGASFYWKGALQEPPPPFSIDQSSEPIRPRSILWTQRAESVGALRDSIFEIFQRSFNIQREKTESVIEFPDVEVSERPTCTFCNQKIIDAEKIFETDHSYVLYNQKSDVLGAHFLIISRRHVRSSENLREDELRDQHSLSCMLIKVLEKQGRKNVFLYTQSAPALAQKVPHDHTHLKDTPNALKVLLVAMNYEHEPTLPEDEMKQLVATTRLKLGETWKSEFAMKVSQPLTA